MGHRACTRARSRVPRRTDAGDTVGKPGGHHTADLADDRTGRPSGDPTTVSLSIAVRQPDRHRPATVAFSVTVQ